MASWNSTVYFDRMSDDAFFPVDAFGKSDDFLAKWYSKFLSSMNEPSLWQASSSSSLQAYRFLWLRTFHQPVVVRMEIDESETGLLIAKVTDGKGGYETGKLIFNETSRLSNQDVEEFILRLNELDFWELPTIDESGAFGVDGSQWVLEGFKNSKHHVLNRWSPKEGAFKETALMLLQLANVRVDNIY